MDCGQPHMHYHHISWNEWTRSYDYYDSTLPLSVTTKIHLTNLCLIIFCPNLNHQLENSSKPLTWTAKTILLLDIIVTLVYIYIYIYTNHTRRVELMANIWSLNVVLPTKYLKQHLAKLSISLQLDWCSHNLNIELVLLH